MFGYEPEGDSGVKLIVSNPASIWGRAGLHSRDRLERIDGASVKTWPELRTKLQGLRMGDSVRRSEERRVGKECRSGWRPDHEKKKETRRGGRRRAWRGGRQRGCA